MGVSEAILVRPEAGVPHSALGIQSNVKIKGEQTSGAYSILEFTFQPGFFVPPHVHGRTDEVSYILEGELGVMVAEDEFLAGPGSFVVRPKGIPHALWASGDRPVRALDIYTPAGFEAFGEELARTLADKPASFEEVAAIGRRHDVTFLPELIPRLIQKYNLRLPG